MKTIKNIILFVLLISCTAAFAQSKAWNNVFGSVDKVSETYLQQLKNANTFKSDNERFIVSADDKTLFTGKNSGEKYNKVVFLVNKEKLYAPAKIEYEQYYNIKDGKKKYVTHDITVFPLGDIKYVENDQIYALKKDIDKKEPYKLKSDATIYNKDGSIKHSIKHQKDTRIIEAYSSNNNLILSFSTDKYGVNEQTNVLNSWMYNKSNAIGELGKIINKTPKGTYKGNAHAGTFQSNTDEIYTGYFAPISGSSNSSVLFCEKDGEANWVLVVGGSIEETIPTTLSQKPNVAQLQQQLEITPYTGKGTYLYNGKQVKLFEGIKRAYTYTSNPTDGYGIKYTSSPDPTPSKEIVLEVGIFAKGKLNGLGYRQKEDAVMQFHRNEPNGLQHNVTVEAGIFSDGILTKGRTFVLDKPEELNSFWHRNYWVKSPIKGFNYIQTDKGPIDSLQFYEKIPYSEIDLSKGSKVYIEKLNRWIDNTRFDKNKRLLVTADNGDEVILDQNIGNVYFESTQNKPVRVNCPTTTIVKKYKTIKEDVNWKDSKGRTVLTEQDRSGYLKPVKIYTSQKTVEDGYETVTCSRCNGSGHYNSYTVEKVIYRLELPSNNFFNKISNALNKASGNENPDTEISLFGTTEHLQFEAESYLNMFNNDATRTYDHLNAYNKRLQYEWIQTAKNAREIYTAFADLFYLIYQKNPNASYYFITTIHPNSYNETVAVITEKYPEPRKYLSTKAKELQKKN